MYCIELAPQIRRRGENAARDYVPFNLGEPEFDLIEPRAVGGREMEMHPRVRGEPVGDGGGLMRAEIIGNEMDLAAGRLRRDERVGSPVRRPRRDTRRC